MDIKKYCEYLYNSLYIPIYLYDNEKLIACCPAQEKDTYPPSPYLVNLWESNKKISYTITKFYSYYGCVKVENSRYSIVLGPINDFPYCKDTLLVMGREFSTSNYKFELLSEFFNNIPQQNLDTFLSTLLFINYTINNSELTRKDIDPSTDNPIAISINKKYIRNSYPDNEPEIFNNSYAFESDLMRFIENGDIEGLKRLSTRAKNVRVGIIANNNLRQLKNLFICAVTLAARAGIRGGITPSVAYQLSDIYIQQMERLTDTDDIKSLLGQVHLDYTNRVANSTNPVTTDAIIQQVFQYVRDNTNNNITVSDVATHVGFTRPSLSRKFKKELGIDLSTFIRNCKLEESKNLLAFSDKSISDISNYLCFSSQSHFQRCFKDSFGITPQNYRKSESFTQGTKIIV
jgi:AraC-like DNA-binding protein